MSSEAILFARKNRLDKLISAATFHAFGKRNFVLSACLLQGTTATAQPTNVLKLLCVTVASLRLLCDL